MCHYHLTQRVMSRVLFKGKVLFLSCCCRKYPYSPIKGVLVWTFPPFWEFQFSSILFFGPIRTRRQIWNCLWNIWTKKSMVTIFVLKKINCSGNYYLVLTGNHICHYLMERIIDLQQKKKWLTRKTPFHLFSRFCPVFPRTNFVHSAFEDCLVWEKICKIVTNHPHL